MAIDLTIGQYIYGNSVLHRIDPRVKILSLISILMVVFFTNSFIVFSILGLFLFSLIKLSDLRFQNIFRVLRFARFYILLTFVINIFSSFASSSVYINCQLGIIHFNIPIPYLALVTAVKNSLRLIFLMQFSSLLTLTTTPILITDAIEKLLSPLKYIHIPVSDIGMIMNISIRFIPIILEETDKIIKAQKSRGVEFDYGNIMKRAKNFVPILIPVFVSTFKRAAELTTAIQARCYRSSALRTRMKQLKLSSLDVKAIIVVSMSILGLIFGFRF